MIRNYLFFCLCLALPCHVSAQSGSLDQTFGQGGKLTTNVPNAEAYMSSVLLQPDGKIIAVGSSGSAEMQGKFCLIRYNPDGTLDDSFGVGGIVETPLGSDEDIAFSGVLQPDGKILVGGYTWNGNNHDFALVRYTAEGLRDVTFGQYGIVTTDFWNGYDIARKVILQPDGKIVLGGSTLDVTLNEDMVFARYLANGQLDGNFGQGGKVVVNMSEPGLSQVAYSLALQTDGKILASGYTDVFDKSTQAMSRSFAAIRLNMDGSLDDTFGTAGIIAPKIGVEDVANSIQIQSDGKILMFGKARLTGSGFDDFALMRCNSNGTLDLNFGNQGVVLTSFDNTHDFGTDMIVQADGKILTFGFTSVNSGVTLDFAMARYRPDGSLDLTFGNNGKVTTDFNNNLDWGSAIAIDPQGKIIAVGRATSNFDTDVALARYINDVALPVALSFFGAIAAEEKVLLRWKTSSETHSDYFEIQRSADGLHWNVLDTLEANHYSSVEATYSLADQRPMQGKSFYRLKMIDFDGSFAYSSITSVYFKSGSLQNSLSIYPNPTSGKLRLSQLPKNKIADVQVFDLKGNRSTAFQLQGQELDLSQLANGFYNVVVTDKEGRVGSGKVLLAK